MPRLHAFALVLLVCLVPACGGGGGGDDEDDGIDVVEIINTRWGLLVDLLSGTVDSTGAANPGGTISVGDSALHTDLRGVYAFALPPLPGGAQLTRVDLATHVGGGTGSPFTDLGAMHVSLIDMGTTLDGDDYDGGTLGADLGVILVNYTQPGTLEVTDAVRTVYAASRPNACFRFWFARGPDDTQSDIVSLVRDAAAEEPPTLRIQFRMP